MKALLVCEYNEKGPCFGDTISSNVTLITKSSIYQIGNRYYQS